LNLVCRKRPVEEAGPSQVNKKKAPKKMKTPKKKKTPVKKKLMKNAAAPPAQIVRSLFDMINDGQ
jgi:hypothetical protein